MEALLLFIENHNTLFLFYVFLIAASIGSFLNVVIFRLPKIMDQEWAEDASAYLKAKKIKHKPIPIESEFNSLSGGSKCPHCKTPIPFYRNIPIFGWLLLRGKSACCNKPISSRYMLIELFSGLVATSLFALYDPAYALFASISIFILITLFFIDMEKQILPFSVMFYLFLTAICYQSYIEPERFSSSMAAGIAVFVGLKSFSFIYEKLRGFNGLGDGDIVLISILAGTFGIIYLPVLMILAVAVTLALYFIKAVRKDASHHEVEGAIAFGPGISAAAIILLVLSNNIDFIY